MMLRRQVAFGLAAMVVILGVSGATMGRDHGVRRTHADVYDERMADWRNHQIVYQVFVDRFAYRSDPGTRARNYDAPRRLMPWTAKPEHGSYVPEAEIYRHEIDFWGGDLQGVTDRLDYIQSMGANVLYLNPIFLAYSNHKYDATDYFQIDPQYGTEEDFKRLCDEAHKRGMKVVLDGVFNHVGRRNAWFQAASKDPSSPFRSFFTFGPNIKNGYLGWFDVANLPELNYNTPAVRNTIYAKPDSAVQKWLMYADGWRLDVAFDLGPEVLSELTAGAHRARPGSFTVGEIYNYPADWVPALDGVMNMYLSRIILNLGEGSMSGPKASEMVDNLVLDMGIEPMLKSWIVLSNHDRSRLKSALPEFRDRAFALELQATLPGCPLLYYGEEIGLTGAEDPEQRGPMDWKLAESGTAPEQQLMRTLFETRARYRALQVGDFARIPTDHLFAFTRMTSSVRDTVVVVANPTDQPVTEIISPRDSWLMDVSTLKDVLTGAEVKISSGLMSVTVPPKTVQIFAPVISEGPNYTNYKRVP